MCEKDSFRSSQVLSDKLRHIHTNSAVLLFQCLSLSQCSNHTETYKLPAHTCPCSLQRLSTEKYDVMSPCSACVAALCGFDFF